MAKLTYFMISSVDGFTASPDGTFDWAEPTPALHRHVQELSQGLVGEIYGPRMWETMRVWEDIRPGDGEDYGDLAQTMYEYGEQWRSIPKHVFSRADGRPLTLEALRELKSASDGELSISGPGIAGVALAMGEVDEVARYIVPVAVGGGTPWWPAGVEAKLELVDQQEVDAGWVYVRYRVLH